MNTYSKFYFRPGRGEQVQTTIRPEPTGAAAICGRVLGGGGRPLPGAMALLQRPREEGVPETVASCVTADDGQFLFGPLEPEQLYLVKIFHNNTKLRELEVSTE